VFKLSYLSLLSREFAPFFIHKVSASNNSTSDADRTMKFAPIIELVLLMCYYNFVDKFSFFLVTLQSRLWFCERVRVSITVYVKISSSLL